MIEPISKMSFGPIRQRRINLFVGVFFKILDIQQYASGFKLGPAARVPAKPLGEDGILNQNPIFEMGSCYNSSHIPMPFFTARW